VESVPFHLFSIFNADLERKPILWWLDEASQVTFSATPEVGYVFSHWLLNGENVGSENPITLTVTGPFTLEPVFEPATYTLTVQVCEEGSSTGVEGATVKIDGAPYTTDSSGKVTATVNYGSHTIEVASPHQPSHPRSLICKFALKR